MLIKITKKIVIVIVLFITLGNTSAKAQDYIFSQFYANPLYLNPALAGTSVCPRLSLAFRDQWPAAGGTFVNFSASYDQYVNPISGGLGLYLSGDQHGAFQSGVASMMYSYRLKIKKNLYMNAALKVSFLYNSLAWDDLTFPDQIDPIYGYNRTSTSAQIPSADNNINVDFGAGLVFYGDNWYAGAAFDHLTQPDQGFYGVSKLPMKITVHAGGLFNIREDERRTSPLGIKSPVISPNVIYQHMLNFNYLSYGLYLDWLPIVVGVWFRQGFENADALVFLVGLQQKSFKIGYSYDLTVSGLSNNNTGGAHEVTFGYRFACPQKKSKKTNYEIKCPSF